MVKARGFTYLGLLFAMAIMASGLGLLGELWHTAVQREKEADLLSIGSAYQRAIMWYYESTNVRQYPRQLEYLLKDNRFPGTRRYLRRLYPDPITGGEWGLMRAADGGIMGVYSTAQARPLKSTRAQSYSDLKFVYLPPTAAAPAAAAPAAGSPATR
jgi:type II secretory pathway pseudopilin PulG